MVRVAQHQAFGPPYRQPQGDILGREVNYSYLLDWFERWLEEISHLQKGCVYHLRWKTDKVAGWKG